MLVHAGTHPRWSVKKTLRRAAEVETALQGDDYHNVLGKMYGNTPAKWSGKLSGYKRLRFIINCLTRMRVMTAGGRLDLNFSGPPMRAEVRVQVGVIVPPTGGPGQCWPDDRG